MQPYDAILLVSFGGPEGPEEVLPFQRRVTAGRGIPDARLEEVGEHYFRFGGRSPINDQNRALLAALRSELDARGESVPLLWGNRNSAPFIVDTLRDAHAAGIRRIVAVTTSAYASYSSCRQYRENLADAVTALAGEGRRLQIDKIGPYAVRPGFREANLGRLVEAMRDVGDVPDAQLALLFVTHSIPDAMDETSGPGDEPGRRYQQQHLALAAELTDGVNHALDRGLVGELVYCSRSGPPTQPWLEPDVNEAIERLAGQGASVVVAAPIGFVSDHMEVVYDLDTEARATAEKLGLGFVRAATAGVDPQFVAMARDLLLERAAVERGEDVVRAAVGSLEPSWDVCPRGCCANARGPRPAICGED